MEIVFQFFQTLWNFMFFSKTTFSICNKLVPMEKPHYSLQKYILNAYILRVFFTVLHLLHPSNFLRGKFFFIYSIYFEFFFTVLHLLQPSKCLRGEIFDQKFWIFYSFPDLKPWVRTSSFFEYLIFSKTTMLNLKLRV